MFKWPYTPAGDSPAHELADYIEMLCWEHQTVSDTQVIGALERIEENDYSWPDGVPEESEAEEYIGDALGEIERRMTACRGAYPFQIDDGGHSLRLEKPDAGKTTYLYLLLATRLNMKTQRCHQGIDGTLLFEKLSAQVAEEYFGARARSFVFGTSKKKRFVDKIAELCVLLNEGIGFREQDVRTTAQDGGLDIVTWKPFADNSAGQLIGFGQCKTGTSYMHDLSLRPEAFCAKWMMEQPLVMPQRMHFIAEALSRHEWRNVILDAGLLFDRCRIVDYRMNRPGQLFDEIALWTGAAGEAIGLPNHWT